MGSFSSGTGRDQAAFMAARIPSFTHFLSSYDPGMLPTWELGQVAGGSDVAAAVIQAVRDSGAEHVVVGEMISPSVMNRFRPTIVDRIIDQLRDSDIHVVARMAQ